MHLLISDVIGQPVCMTALRDLLSALQGLQALQGHRWWIEWSVTHGPSYVLNMTNKLSLAGVSIWIQRNQGRASQADEKRGQPDTPFVPVAARAIMPLPPDHRPPIFFSFFRIIFLAGIPLRSSPESQTSFSSVFDLVSLAETLQKSQVTRTFRRNIQFLLRVLTASSSEFFIEGTKFPCIFL